MDMTKSKELERDTTELAEPYITGSKSTDLIKPPGSIENLESQKGNNTKPLCVTQREMYNLINFIVLIKFNYIECRV